MTDQEKAEMLAKLDLIADTLKSLGRLYEDMADTIAADQPQLVAP